MASSLRMFTTAPAILHSKLAGKAVRATDLSLQAHQKLKVKARVHFLVNGKAQVEPAICSDNRYPAKFLGDGVNMKINGRIAWTSKT